LTKKLNTACRSSLNPLILGTLQACRPIFTAAAAAATTTTTTTTTTSSSSSSSTELYIIYTNISQTLMCPELGLWYGYAALCGWFGLHFAAPCNRDEIEPN